MALLQTQQASKDGPGYVSQERYLGKTDNTPSPLPQSVKRSKVAANDDINDLWTGHGTNSAPLAATGGCASTTVFIGIRRSIIMA